MRRGVGFGKDGIGPTAPGALSRRAWLAGSVIAGLGMTARGAGPEARGSEDGSADAIRTVQAEARKAGLAEFRTSETKHFLGIGDGPEAYRRRALDICQELATAYQRHFRDKGFAGISLPERRLVVMTLKGRESYEKMLGEKAGPDVGGHFDLDANRLVIYDFRAPAGEPVANAERVNTFTLVHEALHLLTFNTGLLNREGDVPLCVSEGLAAYGEVWRPSTRAPFGQHNSFRRGVLAQEADLPEAWLPVAKLLGDDTLLSDDGTAQLAYAQSWVLVHFLMRTPAKLRGFRAYLAAIRERTDGSQRLEDASKHLGDPDRLDRDVRKHAGRLLEERS
jgi:hypothetical protein